MQEVRTDLKIEKEIDIDYQDYLDRQSNIPSPEIIQSGKKGMEKQSKFTQDKTSTKDK